MEPRILRWQAQILLHKPINCIAFPDDIIMLLHNIVTYLGRVCNNRRGMDWQVDLLTTFTTR
jgi:hypothetical protein